MKQLLIIFALFIISTYFSCAILPKKSPNSYMEAGKKYYDKKDYVKAYKNYSRAIKLNPNLYTAYWERATAEIAMDSLEKAIDDISVYIESTPSQELLQKAYFQRALILDKRGYKSDACDDLNRACELTHNKSCDLYRLKCK